MNQTSYIKALFLTASTLLFSITFVCSVSAQQDAKLIKINEWGAGRYGDSVYVNDLIYHSTTNSTRVYAQRPDLNQQDAYVGHFDLPRKVRELYACNGYLGMTDYTSNNVEFFNVNDMENPTSVSRVNITGSIVPESFMCEDSVLTFMTNGGRLYSVSFVDDRFSLIDIFENTFIADQEEVRTGALGLVNDTLFALFYLENNDNSELSRFVMYEFSFEQGTFNMPIEKTAQAGLRIFDRLVYTHSGSFILTDTSENILVINKNGDELQVHSPLNLGSRFDLIRTSYSNEQLWVTTRNKEISIYDLSDLDNITETSSSQVEDEVLPDWDGHTTLFLGERFYMRTRTGFYEIVEHSGSFISEPLYHIGGYSGPLIIRENKAYLARDGRIDVLDIEEIKTPFLEQQIVLDNDFSSNIFATDTTLIYWSANSGVVTSDISGGVNFEDTFTTNVSDYGYLISGVGPIKDYVFGYSNQAILHRYNVAEPSSSVNGPESINLDDIPEALRFNKPDLVGLNEHVVVAVRFSNDLYMFKNESDLSMIVPQTIPVSSQDPVEDIATYNDYLFVLVNGNLETYQLSNEDVLIKLWTSAVSETIEKVNPNSEVRNIDVVGNYLLISETNYSGESTTAMYKIREDGQITYVSDSRIETTTFSGGYAKYTEMNGYFIAPSEAFGYEFYQINQAPQLSLTEFIGLEDESVFVSLNEVDKEGDRLSIEVLSSSDNGTIDFNDETNALTFIPMQDYFGNVEFTLKVSDEHGNFSEPTLSFQLTNVNDVPTALASTINASVFVGQSVTTDLAVSDIDDDNLIYEIIQAPTSGTASVTTNGRLTYTASLIAPDIQTIIVEATDNYGAKVSVSVAYSVSEEPVLEESGGGSVPATLLILLTLVSVHRLQRRHVWN